MKYILFLVIYLSIFMNGHSQYKFSDNTHVAIPGKYKIDISQKTGKHTTVVHFTLYQKNKAAWTKIQSGKFTKGDIALAVITEEDLNNDGYNDLKISYEQAGRGANEINKLLLFDPKKNNFTEIINSQNYPNLHYNKKRNCINAYAFHGGNTTYFLKIVQNQLKEFARVEYANDTIMVYTIKNGKERLLKTAAYTSSDAATFFTDYDPVE